MTAADENRDQILTEIGNINTKLAVLAERIDSWKEHGERISRLELTQARGAWIPTIFMTIVSAIVTAVILTAIR